MAPLQKLRVKPIEDPSEQAALDERLRRSEEAARPGGPDDCVVTKPTPIAVLELCRQLSAKGRLRVVAELAEQLSVDQRVALAKRLTAQLPPDRRSAGNRGG
jgi:hypothetical protein